MATKTEGEHRTQAAREKRRKKPKYGKFLAKNPAESRRQRRQVCLQICFYALSLPFLELLLRLTDKDTTLFAMGLLRALFAGAAAGMLLWLIGMLIPRKGISRALIAAALFFFAAVLIAERCCRSFYGV